MPILRTLLSCSALAPASGSTRRRRLARAAPGALAVGWAAAWVVGSAAVAGTAQAAAACEVRSDAATAALVELYTSEGCSSCPPADRQLRDLAAALDAGARAVPIALHVDYWDGLGWRDPYAQRVHAERQRELVQRNGHRTLVTPHFFVSGRELGDGAAGLRAAVRAVNAQPSPVTLTLAAGPVDPEGGMTLHLSARWARGMSQTPLSVRTVLTESGLSQQVRRGENQGATLTHDHVVRRWAPARDWHGDRLDVDQRWTLAPGGQPSQWSFVAFVQNPAGEVLQAVRLPLAGCGS